MEQLLESLEQNAELVLIWFKNNCTKLITDKCDLVVSGFKHEHVCAKIGTDKIWETRAVKLFGINIDDQLKFDKHVLENCSKLGRKLSALA